MMTRHMGSGEAKVCPGSVWTSGPYLTRATGIPNPESVSFRSYFPRNLELGFPVPNRLRLYYCHATAREGQRVGPGVASLPDTCAASQGCVVGPVPRGALDTLPPHPY